MSQTAVHRVDHVILHGPVRQWVLLLPTPQRVLLAALPELVSPVLQGPHRIAFVPRPRQTGDTSTPPPPRSGRYSTGSHIAGWSSGRAGAFETPCAVDVQIAAAAAYFTASPCLQWVRAQGPSRPLSKQPGAAKPRRQTVVHGHTGRTTS